MHIKFSSKVALQVISVFWVTWILAEAVKALILVFPSPDAELNGDAFWSYLPSARLLLKDPWWFLTRDEASFQVAPLGYIWPAIWGASHERTQLANCVLFLLSILMLWRLSTRLGGLIAGMASTSLLVFWPELTTYIPQVLTEAIYLFGFLLMLLGITEYLLNAPARSRSWLSAAALGLAITLLSRPVLQLYALACVLAICIGLYVIRRRKRVLAPSWELVFNPAILIALVAALALPAATVVKNSVCFGYHGLSTGAGSGLYYGVSPFAMGVEPIYAGFSHEASVIPAMADPSTKGSPLRPRSDAILTQTAISIVQNTSLGDNLRFFTFKLQNWLFFGPEDLRIKRQLRKFRTFEWLAILAALTMIAVRTGIGLRSPGFNKLRNAELLPNADGLGKRRLAMFALMLLLTAGMVGQLIPVLYNIRYNLFFLEPLLIPLCGISLSMLLRWRKPASTSAERRTLTSSGLYWLKWAAPRILLIALLAHIPTVLTKHALRHRAWSMDPLRPGPTHLLLDQRHFGEPTAVNALPLAPLQWTTSKAPAILNIPVTLYASQSLDHFLNGMWRFKLAVQPPRVDRNCNNVRVQLTHPGVSTVWYVPEPIIHVQPDGALHLYALHGNGNLRPTASGTMQLVFNCPEGTIIQWAGAQYLQITTPEAARELVNKGTQINPYRADDIR